MPELPETETIARDLHAEVAGRRIVDVVVERADVLREVSPTALRRRVAGTHIERCWRRAKLVVLDLSGGDRIVVQPRFTGALILDAGAMDERERRFSTLHFRLDDGRLLHYRDIRRLGTVAVMSPERFAEYEGALGIEPLDPAFTAAHLAGVLAASRQAVKKVLMDQRRVVGIGNIYANEALWRARIAPHVPARDVPPRRVRTLRDAIVGVLEESIAERGTSFRDYVDASGSRGGFAARLQAYGRGGLPCPRCRRVLDETHDVDGRSSVWCSRCQG